MKMKGKGCVMAAAVMLTALIVSPVAFAGVGPYVGIESGLDLDAGSRATVTVANNPPSSGSLKLHDGFIGGITAGYALPGHLRPELELDYRAQAGSGVSATTVLGNVWYDFETRRNYFYLGGGLGYAHLRLNQSNASSDDKFVYQIGVGAGFFIDPRLSIGVDYRYLRTSGRASFNGQVGGMPVKTRLRYRNQTVMLGLRYNFGNVWDPLNPYREQRPVRVVPLDTGS